MVNRTVVIVTHRPSTLRNAEISVIHRGKIIEEDHIPSYSRSQKVHIINLGKHGLDNQDMELKKPSGRKSSYQRSISSGSSSSRCHSINVSFGGVPTQISAPSSESMEIEKD